jgi:hypothetical protein
MIFMAQTGKYQIPAEYKDEDRWWKFTKRQLVYVIIGLMIDYFFFKIFQPMGLSVVWIFLDVVVSLFFGIIAMVPIPQSSYLHGGGMMLEAVILRMLMRKFNRVLYTKNYDRKENC